MEMGVEAGFDLVFYRMRREGGEGEKRRAEQPQFICRSVCQPPG